MEFSIKYMTFIALLATINPFLAFEIDDCTQGTNSSGKLKAVTIDTCPGLSGPFCPLYHGKNVSIAVEFDTLSEFSVAKIAIYGYIGALKEAFSLSPDNACGNYGFDCPVKPNDTKKLSISLPILKVYPDFNLRIELEMNDENKNPIICLRFPAKITDP